MVSLDVAPVTVRGPLSTTNMGQVRFARIFVHDDTLYIAEGRNRGAIVTRVTAYPLPEGEPERNPRKNKAGTWGPWRWDSCGCGNSWGRHSVESLVAKATPLLEPDLSPSVESDAGEGSPDEADLTSDSDGDLAAALTAEDTE